MRDADPEAEHTVLMHDMEYIIEADKRGFKYGVISEHHFLDEYSHSSAPEVMMGYLAHATKNIHIMAGIFNPLPKVNHPARVAERAAMLDHLTEGRFEFGTGRGAGSYEIKAFLDDIESMSETKDIWEDVIGEFPKMWTQEIYEGHSSKYWQLPPRRVLPRPYGEGHPPIWYAAGNPTSWVDVARKGIGLIGFSLDNLETAAKAVKVYKDEVANAEPIGAFVNDYVMGVSLAAVHEDAEKALGWATSAELAYYESVQFRYHDTFPRPAHVPEWPAIAPRKTREEAIAMRENGALFGDPDDAIRTLKRWEAAGVDGVLVAVGHLGHEHAMETLRVFGEYIIPEVDKDPVHRTTRMRNAASKRVVTV
jgi:alkanesulfonate monooxygenase SsuD/methylene tetrahydromethanopterin reductase-like flavin-dependent oxidoreductase (luciferase family)